MYGLVLEGGGARGAYHIGAYRALEELDMVKDITVVTGTSIGSHQWSSYSSRRCGHCGEAVERAHLFYGYQSR